MSCSMEGAMSKSPQLFSRREFHCGLQDQLCRGVDKITSDQLMYGHTLQQANESKFTASLGQLGPYEDLEVMKNIAIYKILASSCKYSFMGKEHTEPQTLVTIKELIETCNISDDLNNLNNASQRFNTDHQGKIEGMQWLSTDHQSSWRGNEPMLSELHFLNSYFARLMMLLRSKSK